MAKTVVVVEEEVLERIEEFIGFELERVNFEGRNLKKEIYGNIFRLLQEIGIKADIRGFKFIKEAIYAVLTEEIGENESIYYYLARIFSEKITKIEKCIRYAIEFAYNSGRYKDEMHMIFRQDKPNNLEFIYTLVEIYKIRYDL